MYIKIFPHGKGTGQAAVNYLTRMDYPGRTENPPVVLRGEPELTKALIASQDRQWKFCAGVLSWGPEDHVTCLLYTSPSPRDGLLSRMPSSA